MKRRILFLASICMFATIHTYTKQTTNKKLILWGMKGVLLYPDMNNIHGGNLGALIGLTPNKVQNELFNALQSVSISILSYTGTYPKLIEGWLTGAINNVQAKNIAKSHIKKKYSLFKKMRLKTAADTAFTPSEAAQVLSHNQAVFNLAQQCKSAGHSIALCSSWNAESFAAVKQKHANLIRTFDSLYISGNCGILACQKQFYDQIITDSNYAPEDIYFIECLPENIQAAQKRGITTINASSTSKIQTELKKHGLI